MRSVVEGSVRKVGDRILITAQVVDATTGGHVWAERYDRPVQDLFALQKEVRRKIVVHLALRLTDEEQEQLLAVGEARAGVRRECRGQERPAGIGQKRIEEGWHLEPLVAHDHEGGPAHDRDEEQRLSDRDREL